MGIVKSANKSTERRLRECFEELGPAFVKLGQLLSTRSDLLPPAFLEEFKTLQDHVKEMSWAEVIAIVKEEIPFYGEMFTSFEEQPLGSASIAQVHAATLKNGSPVVIKVQRPGIQKIISEDIQIMKFIAGFLDRNLPELETLNLPLLAEEFAFNLNLETDFSVETNNLVKVAKNFKDDERILVPYVYEELSTKKVIVMEKVQGIKLTALNTESDKDSIIQVGLDAYFYMVLKHGIFHADPHAGNLLVTEDNRLALIDLGMVGRLSKGVRLSIIHMFVALAKEDYDRLAFEYMNLGGKTHFVNRRAFAESLRKLISPYFGLNLENVNLGKILIDSASVSMKHKVYLPYDLMLFFKSLVTIEGLAREVKRDFDILPYVFKYATEAGKIKLDPKSFAEDIEFFSREFSVFLKDAPTELRGLLSKINDPNYVKRIELKEVGELSKEIKNASFKLFYGLTLSSLLIAGAVMSKEEALGSYQGLSVISCIFFIVSGVILLRFFLRLR